MSLLEELLAPIEDEAPAGPDLRGSNEFAAIERAFLDADTPAHMTPGGADEGEDAGEAYREVAGLCIDFLQHRSKDLKVAVFLAASLLRAEGFPGFATGLETIRDLLKDFWEGLHPATPSRAPILDWFGSDDLSYALYLVPLTESGHRYSEYKKWVKEEAEAKSAKPRPGARKADEAEEEGPDFGSAFGQTSWDWYEERVAALHRCNGALEELDALGKELFPAADEKPPRYASLADALKRVTAAAEDLLRRKPAPSKPAPSPTESSGSAMEEAQTGQAAAAAPGGATPPSSATAFVSAEPSSPEEAAALVAVAARVMRRKEPWNPSPYLLLRGLRWGELRSGGEPLDPRVLEAPSTAQRTHLKTLFLDKKWAELLDAAEEIMATPAGRGWLDLQRYVLLAASRQGPDFQHLADGVRSAFSSLLGDFPSLLQASLMDDSPTASRDTMAWLEEEGLLPSPDTANGKAEEQKARQADRIIREAGFDRAVAMARAGDPQGAVEMLMERAEHERSQRARFIAKAQAAEIMVNHGMGPVARPILDELLALVEQHQLESWEPAYVIAKPMGLLLKCLDPREAPLKQKIYPRLAKLDPILAMRVEQQARAEAAGPAGQPGAQQPQQPQAQPNEPGSQPPTGAGGPGNG